MSIYTLARSAARAGSGPGPGALTAAYDGGQPKDSTLTNAANALAKYIPKEIVTLYVAGLSAASALKAGAVAGLALYVGFILLTGPIYLLVYLSFLKANGKTPPPRTDWPWWRAGASTIAFAVWALAIPGIPFTLGATGSILAAFLALFVSTILSLLDPWLDNVPRSY